MSMSVYRRGTPNVAITIGKEKTAIRFELCFSDDMEETTAADAAYSYRRVIEQLKEQSEPVEVIESFNLKGRAILSWVYYVDSTEGSEIVPALERLTAQLEELRG